MFTESVIEIVCTSVLHIDQSSYSGSLAEGCGRLHTTKELDVGKANSVEDPEFLKKGQRYLVSCK